MKHDKHGNIVSVGADGAQSPAGNAAATTHPVSGWLKWPVVWPGGAGAPASTASPGGDGRGDALQEGAAAQVRGVRTAAPYLLGSAAWSPFSLVTMTL